MSTSTSTSTSTPPTLLLTPSQLPQTYPNALHLLSLLPTNRDTTDLFAALPAGRPAAKAKDDLNARALPEFRAWLARAGYTPDGIAASGLRCVHVAGTKGKGSTCAFLTAALVAAAASGKQDGAGLVGRVGTYTSPHVVSVRERILLDGKVMSRELFARYVFELWGRLTRAAAESGQQQQQQESEVEGGFDGPATKPFYFRFLTLLALHVFVSEGVRSAVIECGIGGEHDPTNVLPREAVSAAVVTRLGVDHVAMLGATVEEIAWHKAGVFKRGRAAFTVGQDAGALEVLRERAGEKGARLRVVDGDERWEGVIQGARLRGGFQRGNMAVAAAAAGEHLRVLRREVQDGEEEEEEEEFSVERIPESFKAAMREATLRGRCETIVDEHGVEWLLDGAHTADSLREVAKLYLSKDVGEDTLRVLVFNQQERDVAALLKALLLRGGESAGRRAFDAAVFTRNELLPAPGGGAAGPRPETSVQQAARDALRELSPGTLTVGVAGSVAEAVRFVRDVCGERRKKGYVLVTGSFNLVRPVLQILDPECED